MDKPSESERSFEERLPGQVEGIEREWHGIRDGEWNTEALEGILLHFERLAHSCGRYRLDRVIEPLAAVEILLASYIGETVKPDLPELDRIDEKFLRLRQSLLETAETPGTPRATRRRGVIYLLRKNHSRHTALTDALADEGSMALPFSGRDDLLRAIAKRMPDLVLVDEASAGDIPSIRKGLDRVRGGEDRETPIACIHGDGDPESRARALGFGVCASFVEPLDNTGVAKAIAELAEDSGVPDILGRPAPGSAGSSKPVSGDRGAGNSFNLPYLTRRIARLLEEPAGGARPFSHGVIHIGFPAEDRVNLDLLNMSGEALRDLVSTVLRRVDKDDIPAGLGDDTLAIHVRRERPEEIFELASSIHAALEKQYGESWVAGFSVHPSVGVRVADARVRDAATLIRQAAGITPLADDRDAPYARRFGPERLNEARGTVDTADSERLASAIRRDRFEVSLLPIVDREHRAERYYELRLEPANDEEPGGFPEGSLRQAARRHNMVRPLDHRALTRGLDALAEARDNETPIRIFVEQTMEGVGSACRSGWLQAQLRARHLVGTDLILEFSSAGIVKESPGLRRLLEKLHDIGVRVALSEFRITPPNLELLRFLGIDLVRLSLDNPRAPGSEVAEAFARVRETGARIILPRLDNPHDLPADWLSEGDLIPSLFGHSGR